MARSSPPPALMLLWLLAALSHPASGEGNSTNTTEMAEGASGNSLTTFSMSAAGLLILVCVLWQGFRFLTSPKNTPPPLLGDAELDDGGSALWMGGSGTNTQARQVVEGSGFTQF